MTLTGNWNYPTSVRFGPGRIPELADACQASGIERPLCSSPTPAYPRCR